MTRVFLIRIIVIFLALASVGSAEDKVIDVKGGLQEDPKIQIRMLANDLADDLQELRSLGGEVPKSRGKNQATLLKQAEGIDSADLKNRLESAHALISRRQARLKTLGSKLPLLLTAAGTCLGYGLGAYDGAELGGLASNALGFIGSSAGLASSIPAMLITSKTMRGLSAPALAPRCDPELRKEFYGQLKKRGIEIPASSPEASVRKMIEDALSDRAILRTPERLSQEVVRFETRLQILATTLEGEPTKQGVIKGIASALPGRMNAASSRGRETYWRESFPQLQTAKEQFERVYSDLKLDSTGVPLNEVLRPSFFEIEKEVFDIASIIKPANAETRIFLQSGGAGLLSDPLFELADAVGPKGEVSVDIKSFHLENEGKSGKGRIEAVLTIKKDSISRRVSFSTEFDTVAKDSVHQILDAGEWISPLRKELGRAIKMDLDLQILVADAALSRAGASQSEIKSQAFPEGAAGKTDTLKQPRTILDLGKALLDDPEYQARELANAVADDLNEMAELRNAQKPASKDAALKKAAKIDAEFAVREEARLQALISKRRKMYTGLARKSGPALQLLGTGLGVAGMAAVGFVAPDVPLSIKVLADGGGGGFGFLSAYLASDPASRHFESKASGVSAGDFKTSKTDEKVRIAFYDQLEKRGVRLPKEKPEATLSGLIEDAYRDRFLLRTPKRLSEEIRRIRNRLEAIVHLLEFEPAKRKKIRTLIRELPVEFEGRFHWSEASYLRTAYPQLEASKEKFKTLFGLLGLQSHDIVLSEVIDPSFLELRKEVFDIRKIVKAATPKAQLFLDRAGPAILDDALFELADSLGINGEILIDVQEFKSGLLPENHLPVGTAQMELKVRVTKDGQILDLSVPVPFNTQHKEAAEILKEGNWIVPARQEIEHAIQSSHPLKLLTVQRKQTSTGCLRVVYEGLAEPAARVTPTRVR